MSGKSIPLEDAVLLCKQYTDSHAVRIFTQCWGCLRFSNGNPEKMCFFNPPNNDGCKFVNEMYDKTKRALF